MKIFNSSELPMLSDTVIALGAFDGVHAGHREVIRTAVDIARAKGLVPTVFTFSDLPKNAFLPEEKRIVPLCSFSERAERISELGVSVLIAPEFSSIRGVGAEEFVNGVLLSRLGARHIVCGEDHRFGAGGSGDAGLLKELCGLMGVPVTIVPPVIRGGRRVSSTLIRELVAEGRSREAEALLR